MWTAKIRLKHDCIIANRCAKFNIMLQSYNVNEQAKGGKIHTSSIHQIVGDKKDIKRFIIDLRKDKRTEYLEMDENTLFLTESSKNKPVSQLTKKIFFVRPVLIDSNGFEHWHLASHQKEELMDFIRKLKPLCSEFFLLSLKTTKLKNVYFPKISPSLSDSQKKALDLAIENGYYRIPRGTDLRNLARLMKISLSTYQQHLRKAEAKVIPDILSFVK